MNYSIKRLGNCWQVVDVNGNPIVTGLALEDAGLVVKELTYLTERIGRLEDSNEKNWDFCETVNNYMVGQELLHMIHEGEARMAALNVVHSIELLRLRCAALEDLLHRFMEFKDSEYVPNTLFDAAATLLDKVNA